MPIPVPPKLKKPQLKLPSLPTHIQGGTTKPTPGPPPPMPAPAPAAPPAPVYGAAPVTAQGQAIRSDAQKAMEGVNTDFLGNTFRSVMQLGDPTQIAKYQQDPRFAGFNFSVDPTSTFSQLQRNEDTGLQDINNGTLGNNTFFSGLRLNDRDNLSQGFTDQRASAEQNFEAAIAQYASALAAGKAAQQQAGTEANTVDFNAANAIEPTPAAISGLPALNPNGTPAKGQYTTLKPLVGPSKPKKPKKKSK